MFEVVVASDERHPWIADVGPSADLESPGHDWMRTSSATARATGTASLHNGLLVAAWARFDNLGDLAARLGISVTAPMPEVVALCYRRFGAGFATELRGAFSIVVVDSDARRLVAVRDPIGLRPLWYASSGQAIALSTTPRFAKQLAGIATEPNEAWIARYLTGTKSAPATMTPWRDVAQLEAGEQLIHRFGDAQSARSRYFRFEVDTASQVQASDSSWVARHRAELDRVVHEQVGTSGQVAFELSGGLDSSSLLALAHAIRDGDSHDLAGVGFAVQELEQPAIDQVLQALRVQHSTVFDQRTISDAHVDRSTQALGHPVQHTITLGHGQLFDACAAAGIKPLISGFGGDQVVTSFAHRAGPELLRAGRLRELWGVVDGSPIRRTRSILGVAKRELLHFDDTSVERQVDRTWPLNSIRPEVAAAFDLRQHFTSSVRPGARAPTVNEWAIDRLQRPEVAIRTSESAVVAADYGVDHRYPLLDIELISGWLLAPTQIKNRGGIPRYLHRAAVQDLLPKQVVWHTPKDMGQLSRSRSEPHAAIAQRVRERLHPRLDVMIDIDRHVRTALALDAGDPLRIDLDTGVHVHESLALRSLNCWLHDWYPAP